MAYDYGYGELENELISVLGTVYPDFEKAEELIKKGADLNAKGNDACENVLSQTLDDCILGFRIEVCWECENEECEQCEIAKVHRIGVGKSMCDIIRFFLKNGFDANKDDGCYGAQCLFALTLSSYNRYMLKAIKLLLDAGARDRTISYDAHETSTPWDFVATEGSYQGCCEGNHKFENLYEAAYQIYKAVDEGRPYSGIDSYEVAVGKKILKVLAEDDGKPTFYPLNIKWFTRKNCYTKKIYFVYEDGALISTQFADFWVDTVIPYKNMVDVSKKFKGVVGSRIKDFNFGHKEIVKGTTHYDQPVTVIEMDSEKRLVISTNHGEVGEEDRAAFFEIL